MVHLRHSTAVLDLSFLVLCDLSQSQKAVWVSPGVWGGDELWICWLVLSPSVNCWCLHWTASECPGKTSEALEAGGVTGWCSGVSLNTTCWGAQEMRLCGALWHRSCLKNWMRQIQGLWAEMAALLAPNTKILCHTAPVTPGQGCGGGWCCCASEGSQPSPGLPAWGWACLLPLLFPRACTEPVGRWMMPFFVPLPCSRVCTGGSICQSPLPADAAATEPCWGARQAKAASSIGPDQHCLAVGAAEPHGRGTSKGLFGVFCGFFDSLSRCCCLQLRECRWPWASAAVQPGAAQQLQTPPGPR